MATLYDKRVRVLAACLALCCAASGESSRAEDWHWPDDASSAKSSQWAGIGFDMTASPRGLGAGLTYLGVDWSVSLQLQTSLKGPPPDVYWPDPSWDWLVLADEYDYVALAYGLVVGTRPIDTFPLEPLFGFGATSINHVKQYVSTVTGWSWYEIDPRSEGWLLFGVRFRPKIDKSRHFGWYVNLTYDTALRAALGGGVAFAK
jgi:hypothetical protein